MKHPCVELYFEVETSKLDIRIWLKTDDTLSYGNLKGIYFMKADEVRQEILSRFRCAERSEVIEYLETIDDLAAFQITYRHDYTKIGVIVYKEWP